MATERTANFDFVTNRRDVVKNGETSASGMRSIAISTIGVETADDAIE
jgi:hypothetical protein